MKIGHKQGSEACENCKAIDAIFTSLLLKIGQRSFRNGPGPPTHIPNSSRHGTLPPSRIPLSTRYVTKQNKLTQPLPLRTKGPNTHSCSHSITEPVHLTELSDHTCVRTPAISTGGMQHLHMYLRSYKHCHPSTVHVQLYCT